MSFLRGLIGKKEPEKEVPKNEAAAKVESRTSTPQNRVNPIAGQDAAAPVQNRKPRVPTPEQRAHFDKMQRKVKNQQVGKALIEQGLVNDEIVNAALRNISGEAGTTIQKSLVQQGFLNESDVLDALASSFGLERVSLQDVQITEDMVNAIEKRIVEKYKIFPVAVAPDEIAIAISDPNNIEVMDDLQRILGRRVRALLCSEDEIDRFIKRFYDKNEIRDIYEGITTELVDAQRRAEELANEVDITEEQPDAPPVVKFVDLVFRQAVHERASDIHIEPTRNGVTIRFRIDGVCTEMPSPPKKWQNAIISRLKVLSGMDLSEKRIPQDGRIKLSMPDRKLDLRVSLLPSIYGESIVMRILDQSNVLLGLEDVGFLPDNITLFNSLIRTPTGVILMTGPTGSGKTTTLYSALSTLNTPEVKIVTIENPVEYMMEGINQVQVNEEVGLDFKTGLRSILRQSPDVLLVGEMRDLETAEIGIRAALTGHLVFSTLHTNDAPSAPGRLVDMGVKPFLVASSLQAVVAQRLLRRLCAGCKQRIVIPEEQLLEVQASAEDIANRESLKTLGPNGCDRCSGSGYKGRTAIHEIMVVETRIRQMIIKGESGFRIKKVALRNGMRSLRMDGWQKTKLGQTSINEVLRITQPD